MAALVTDITRQEPLQEDSQILGTTEIKGCLEIVRQAGHVLGNVDSPSAERQWMIPVRRQQVEIGRGWRRRILAPKNFLDCFSVKTIPVCYFDGLSRADTGEYTMSDANMSEPAACTTSASTSCSSGVP